MLNPSMTADDIESSYLAAPDDLDPETYPVFQNISSAFLVSCLPVPNNREKPEFIAIPPDRKDQFGPNISMETFGFISQWNTAWECAQLRSDMFHEDIPEHLHWIERFRDKNLYLIPDINQGYHRFSPLYHLLPKRLLLKHNLPLLKKGMWPNMFASAELGINLTDSFQANLSRAVAEYLWPLICSGSSLNSFSEDESTHLLAHNLDFWLPHAFNLSERILQGFPRVNQYEESKVSQFNSLRKALEDEPDITAQFPRMGGMLWMGEDQAWDSAQRLVQIADQQDKLKSIIDCFRSNRVEEDFSNRWSHAKEDFERKLFKKRSKIKVSFVELDDTVPIQGPNSEVEGDIVWEDFFTLLNHKERHIMVCIRNGTSSVTEISDILGYANHSPISKALSKIRRKAEKYFN